MTNKSLDVYKTAFLPELRDLLFQTKVLPYLTADANCAQHWMFVRGNHRQITDSSTLLVKLYLCVILLTQHR